MIARDRVVLAYVANHPGCGRADVRRHVAPEASRSTVWRALRRLVDAGKLQVVGEGRATRYRVAGGEAVHAHLLTPVHLRPRAEYRGDFLRRYQPNETGYLTVADREQLERAGTPAIAPLSAFPGVTYAVRVLEELEIDMSWASSRLEGNSYDLLDTERLVRSARAARGRSRRDTVMILNHKDAIRHVVGNLERIGITAPDLCNIHALLAHELITDPFLRGGLRRMPVAIGRSTYTPPDDPLSIRDEFDTLVRTAGRIEDPFEQSFFLLVHIPYLQPFADVNKRTSRIASIIPLLKADLAPMSFLAIDDADYIRGLLGVYEMNDVSLLREAFVNGYVASAERYRYLRPEIIDPAKGGLEYRRFTRSAVRRCVLVWRAFRPGPIRRLMDEADIPTEDRDSLADHIRRCFCGLTESNAVCYGLRPEALAGLELNPPEEHRRPHGRGQRATVARHLEQP